jgi:ureidoglycolate hydrolase
VEAFRPYGQLILPREDGTPFDSEDALLDLSRGVPRFYLMRLRAPGRKFHRVTRHDRCTQCLGSLGGREWWLAVAPPDGRPEPDIERLAVFRVPHDRSIKLEVGTWHAGPLFEGEFIDFYNLELGDTNLVDHFTHDFRRERSLEFSIVDPA